MIKDVHTYFGEDPEASYYRDGRKYWQSVHGKNYIRYNKAKKEITEKTIISKEIIIECINELLKAVGVAEVKNPIMHPSVVDYTLIKKRIRIR